MLPGRSLPVHPKRFRRRKPGDATSTMQKQRRIAFWFGNEVEVRYLSAVPEIGDYVTHDNELWLVSNVGEDAFGTAVICDRARKREPAAR